jgi:hypothetical protein
MEGTSRLAARSLFLTSIIDIRMTMSNRQRHITTLSDYVAVFEVVPAMPQMETDLQRVAAIAYRRWQ